MAKRKGVNEYKLVGDSDFRAVEAYKALRTNLEYSFIDSNGKVIVVTSALPDEGKTSVVANLGAYLTFTGHKVLLVDCDLRKPKLHRYFNTTNHVGLTNVIMRKNTLEGTVKCVNSRLSILCSGPIPPNSVELLNSKSMKELIKVVSAKYDYILLDTPPASQLADAVVLSPVASGVLLVIKHASTPVEAIKQTINNFKKVNANIIGTVLSRIAYKKLGYHKYIYYQMGELESQSEAKYEPKSHRRKYNY